MARALLLLIHCVLIVAQSTEVTEVIDIDAAQCSTINLHEIENHLSTKTPYRAVANLDDAPIKYAGCRATRMWSVIRHGTRNPSKAIIKDAKNDLAKLKMQILINRNTRMCPEELARMRFWHFNVSQSEQKNLVAEGEDELTELAERIQKRFPELLPVMYDAKLYNFKYTATQRTLKSAQSFATGLFGRHHIGDIVYPEALHRDPVLRVTLLNNETLSLKCRWKYVIIPVKVTWR